mmetsp:Transcript_100768/g.288980  ORF Transcript_100768/g.288980 Transcript_100768/m.288980 type:complete len:203 (-) Transcript_100768:595-1203(-)
MMLPPLELAVGAEVRVLVVQADHEAHKDKVLTLRVHVVEERATKGRVQRTGLEWPPEGVLDETGLVILRRHLPHLLDAETVGLHISLGAEVEGLHELLTQRTTATLGEEGLARTQFDSRLVGALHLALLVDTHVAGSHTEHSATILIVHDLGCGEAWVDLNAQLFGLFTEPLNKLSQRDDVVALVVELRRQDEVGDLEGLRL